MLSISNIQKINRQIAEELRKSNSILYSHDEKMEAIQRATALQKLLSDRDEMTTEPTAPARSIRRISVLCR